MAVEVCVSQAPDQSPSGPIRHYAPSSKAPAICSRFLTTSFCQCRSFFSSLRRVSRWSFIVFSISTSTDRIVFTCVAAQRQMTLVRRASVDQVTVEHHGCTLCDWYAVLNANSSSRCCKMACTSFGVESSTEANMEV